MITGLDLAKTHGFSGTEEELMLLGASFWIRLRGGGAAEANVASAKEPKVRIINSEKIRDRQLVYPSDKKQTTRGPLVTKNTEYLNVAANGEVFDLNIFREIYNEATGKLWETEYAGKNWVVVGGYIDKRWKMKDFFFEGDNRYAVPCWGFSNANPNRHKFNKDEAELVAKRLGKQAEYDPAYRGYKIVIDGDSISFAKAFLAMYNKL